MKFLVTFALACITVLIVPSFASAEQSTRSQLKNIATGRCLNSPQTVTGPEMPVSIASCKPRGDVSQTITLVDLGNGQTSIRNARGNVCLNLKRPEHKNGGHLKWVDCSSHADQRWAINGLQTVTGMQTEFKQIESGKCLEVRSRNENRNGGRAAVYTCSKAEDVRWALLNLSATELLSDLKIASHNVWFMTILGTNIGKDRGYQDVSDIEARSRAIVEDGYLADQDIVVLNELFDNGASNNLLNGLRAEYPHQTGVAGRSTRGSTGQWDETLGAYRPRARLEAGVAIVSKWPIERKVQYLFEHGDSCGWDSLANKGFAYAKINYRNAMKVHVIATHLQSEEPLACEDANDPGSTAGHRVRTKQLQVIRNFIDSQRIPSTEPVFVVGDLNINSGTQEATRMLAILDAKAPIFTGNRGSYDTTDNPLKGPSNLYPEILDYVLALKGHAAPEPWYSEIRKKNGMADHYPVFGSSLRTGAVVTPDLSEYKIAIHTSNRRGAGTDSNVVAIINGKIGKSRRIGLNDRVYRNAFERGSVENIKLEAQAMSDPVSVTFEFDDKYPGSDWRIDRIEIRKIGTNSLWIWSGDFEFTRPQNQTFNLKKER